MKEPILSVTKKDLQITYFNGTGKGGQHRNKHENCVRMRHAESGVMVTGQDQRSKEQNLKTAFIRLTEHPKFKTWLSKQIHYKMTNEKPFNMEEWLDEQMKEDNLLIEYLREE